MDTPSTVSSDRDVQKFQNMTTGSFPVDPSSRRAILILQAHDIEQCTYEPDAAQALLDDEAHVLQFPLTRQSEVPQALKNILNAGLARPGHMLVQSPYDTETYEEAAQAPQRFALAKHMYFSMLCMHLGAKEVVVEQIDLRTHVGKRTLNVKGEQSGGNAQTAIETEDLEQFRAQLNLRDEFEGGSPDIAAAEQLLRRTGLMADQNMRSLVEMRRDGANKLKSRKLVLSLSNEAKSNLNVVGRLNVPKFVTLSAEYKRVAEERQEYTLTVVVNF